MPGNKAPAKTKVQPLRLADAARGIRHVFVRDFVTAARIGAYQSENGRTQKVRINIDLAVNEESAALTDRLEDVVCYDRVVADIKTIIAAGHINLVETLAERIAGMALQDHRVVSVRVRVEKLQAVEGAASVGVEVERERSC
ncbi:MAG TPA: dihydroneopterin aldolase [Sphingomonadales bacterium]|nr:dihydroneopterin aldolase [Sphingomonadales bacterium]